MMRIGCLLLVCALCAPAWAQSFQLHGFLSARAIYVKAPPSWVDGDFGKFDVGAASKDDHRTANIDVAQLGVDWTPTTWLLVHGDGLARNGRAAGGGKRAGIVQAYVDLYSDKLRLRAGAFWLPTSRENVDPLWNSRYTITYSALNAWIGQEVRPIGADLQFSPNFYATVGATAFKGNDTMGTLLAARGFTLGNRLTVYDEVVPAAADPTRPIGHDIDGKYSFAERIRFQLPERAMVQFTHIDNRAQLRLGEPPDETWRTRFNIVGLTLGTTGPTTFAAEWMYGPTTIGFPGGTFTVDFDTAYALLSHKSGGDRWTARIERFRTNGARGRAYTAAWLHDVSKSGRTGIEYVRASGPNGGSTVTFELRYAF